MSCPPFHLSGQPSPLAAFGENRVTTTRAPPTRRATRSPRRSATSRAAPAGSSPSGCGGVAGATFCAPVSSCSCRATATAAPIAYSRRSQRHGFLRVLFVDPADRGVIGRRARRAAALCGSRRRAIRCCGSPILRRARALGTRRGGAGRGDNTFLSPARQRPLRPRADLVVHSTTKYMNGHSDVVGGAVVARHRNAAGGTRWWANCLGLTGAPFDSFLTLRGLRTLHARLAAQPQRRRRSSAVLALSPGGAARLLPGTRQASRDTRSPRTSRAGSAPC